MSDTKVDYPLPLDELMKLWLEFGARLHIASISEDGVATISADVAMAMACDAVAVGASDLMVKRFDWSFLDPEAASSSIKARARDLLEKTSAARALSADRTAEIYAARFGLVDPQPQPPVRSR